MPVFDNSKAIYVNLYKELTNKHTPINGYLTGGGNLNKNEKAVGIAIKQYIRRFEACYGKLTTREGKEGSTYRNDVDYETAKKNMADDEVLFGELERDIQAIRAALLTSARYKRRDDINFSEHDPVAAQFLRDALRYHKEMKEEADRRREYVKLINDQHQSYAIWKEQIIKEVAHYKEVLKYCSPETRKRFNDDMEKYKSTDAMLDGARKWFENEYKNYVARLQVIAEKKAQSENTAGEIAVRAVEYNQFLEQMERDLETAKNDVDEFRNQPDLDEDKIQKDTDDLENNFTEIQALKQEIHVMELDFQEKDNIRDEMEAVQNEHLTVMKEHRMCEMDLNKIQKIMKDPGKAGKKQLSELYKTLSEDRKSDQELGQVHDVEQVPLMETFKEMQKENKRRKDAADAMIPKLKEAEAAYGNAIRKRSEKASQMKNHQELEKDVQDKAKKLQEKRRLLDQLLKTQTILGEKVEKARKLKKELEEKQAAYVLFCFMYEHDMNELEQKRIELEKLWVEQDEQYESEEEHSKDFIKDYQYLENGFVKGSIITERKMDDMTKFKTNHVNKLTEDADKQRTQIREKQSKRCDAIHKELEQFRQEIAKLSQPKGSAKSKNSREFDLFKYELRSYLDTVIKVADEDNPGTTRDETNTKCIYIDLDLIRDQKNLKLSDEKRIECMKNIRNMMDAIDEAADVYLKSQEGVNRETELDRARYNTVSQISMYARKCKLEFVCMMLEERFCTDAPNLNLVQAKSGIEKTDYPKPEAFKNMLHEQQYKHKPEVNGPEIVPN